MKDQSKIQLSLLEMDLVNNADWILTKNGIIQKAIRLLTGLQEKQQDYFGSFSQYLPGEVLKSSPKISKGENYQGLPYLILDFPRFFEHKNIFAIRTMFWWGNFFSITLHLSGNYKTMFAGKIVSSFNLLKEKDFFICIHEEQWQHHFKSDNYTPISKWNKDDFTYMVNAGSFIKLASKIPLRKWNDAQEILLKYFKQIIEALTV
jgi:hypothetical protein